MTAGTPDIAESFETGGWQFTPEVAGVFPEHVRASVPFYDTIQDLIAETADWLVPAGGLVADFGAATGLTAERIIERQPDRGIRFALYDEQQSMLDQARATLTKLCAPGEIAFHAQRVQDPPLQHTDADLSLMLFTLQFLPMRDRVAALRMARTSAIEGGALIVAEKVRQQDSRWAEIGNDVSHDWKAGHGISDAAIRAKARALRGVLIPFSQTQTINMIITAGWTSPEVLFRWHSWVVIGAFATDVNPPRSWQ